MGEKSSNVPEKIFSTDEETKIKKAVSQFKDSKLDWTTEKIFLEGSLGFAILKETDPKKLIQLINKELAKINEEFKGGKSVILTKLQEIENQPDKLNRCRNELVTLIEKNNQKLGAQLEAVRSLYSARDFFKEGKKDIKSIDAAFIEKFLRQEVVPLEIRLRALNANVDFLVKNNQLLPFVFSGLSGSDKGLQLFVEANSEKIKSNLDTIKMDGLNDQLVKALKSAKTILSEKSTQEEKNAKKKIGLEALVSEINGAKELGGKAELNMENGIDKMYVRIIFNSNNEQNYKALQKTLKEGNIKSSILADPNTLMIEASQHEEIPVISDFTKKYKENIKEFEISENKPKKTSIKSQSEKMGELNVELKKLSDQPVDLGEQKELLSKKFSATKTKSNQSEKGFKLYCEALISELKKEQPDLMTSPKEKLLSIPSHKIKVEYLPDNSICTTLPGNFEELKIIFPKVLEANIKTGVVDLSLSGPKQNIEYMAERMLKRGITPIFDEEAKENLKLHGYTSESFIKMIMEKTAKNDEVPNKPDPQDTSPKNT